MKVEKIKKQKNSYKIFLDNGITVETTEEVILGNGLLYDKNINQNTLNKIKEDTKYYKAYNKVIDLISRRLRSEKEVIDYLKKEEINNEDINEIVTSLKRIGLIDDVRFTQAYINDKLNLSKDGPYKISKELKNYNIDESVTRDALDNIDTNLIAERLDNLISKKAISYQKYPIKIMKSKLTNYLVNLGYSIDDINDHIDNIKNNHTLLNKEMDKIYNSLKNKYTEEELFRKFTSKLYSKGYTKDEIDNYIAQFDKNN